MNFLKNLFGSDKTDLKALISSGAKIIDVRTKEEFREGHVKGSVNIPLDQIRQGISKFKKEDTLILCCRSGMRSASATSMLKAMGFKNVFNGGSWTSL